MKILTLLGPVIRRCLFAPVDETPDHAPYLRADFGPCCDKPGHDILYAGGELRRLAQRDREP